MSYNFEDAILWNAQNNTTSPLLFESNMSGQIKISQENEGNVEIFWTKLQEWRNDITGIWFHESTPESNTFFRNPLQLLSLRNLHILRIKRPGPVPLKLKIALGKLLAPSNVRVLGLEIISADKWSSVLRGTANLEHLVLKSSFVDKDAVRFLHRRWQSSKSLGITASLEWFRYVSLNPAEKKMFVTMHLKSFEDLSRDTFSPGRHWMFPWLKNLF